MPQPTTMGGNRHFLPEQEAAGAGFTPIPESCLEENLIARFRRVVEDAPKSRAVYSGDRRWSYEHLAEKMLGLAEQIRRLRPSKDRPVAILVDQGPDFVMSLLATMQAGHFWVPLDPRVPEERNRVILEEAQPSLLLTQQRHAAACPPRPELRSIKVDNVRCADLSRWKTPSTRPDELAYVLFTSGSTGRPKGVMQPHRSVLQNALRHINFLKIRPRDRQSLLYPCSVYGGVRDILNAILSGAGLFHYNLPSHGVGPISDWLRKQDISILCSVATVFRQLTDQLSREACQPEFPNLRIIKAGGEAVYRSDVNAFRRYFGPHTKMLCGLGATEVGAATQLLVDHHAEIPHERVSCGRPARGVTVHILDSDGRELPPGHEGEIAVESEFITAGYWNQPEITSRVLTAQGRTRCYRTGDLGVLGHDGSLIHRGRRDHQVKIRGNRVEIPEIESALLDWNRVRAVVVKSESTNGVTRLRSWIVPIENPISPLSTAEVRSFLASKLPDYMIPARIEFLDKLPMLANGKIDHVSLDCDRIEDPKPEPVDEPKTVRLSAHATAKPREVLTGLWQRLFELQPISDDDDFFELGGDSVMMMDLVASLDRAFECRFPLSVVTEQSRFAGMLERVTQRLNDEEGPLTIRRITCDRMEVCTVAIRTEGSKPPIFFCAPAGGVVTPYFKLARLLGDDQPFYAVSVATARPFDRTGTRIEIPAACRAAADLIREIAPHSPIALGGWSFGGFMAWELAGRLADDGHEVVNTWLIDSDSTLVGKPRTLSYRARCFHLWWRFLSSNVRSVIRGVRRDWNDPDRKQLMSDPESWLYQWRLWGMVCFVQAIREYSLSPLDLPVTLIRAGATSDSPLKQSLGWNEYSTDLKILHAGGDHFTVFREPHVNGLAELLRTTTRSTLGGRRKAS